MQNENTKNDLLKEIVNLSNSNFDNLDLMLDTSKIGNVMKDFEQTKKRNYSMKLNQSTKTLNFNFDQALSENIIGSQNPPEQKQDNIILEKDSNINEIIQKEEPKENNNDKINDIFDEADDILNNFNKKLKKNENNLNNLKMYKSLSTNIKLNMNPIIEVEENNKDDKKQENNNIENDNNENNNIEIENKIENDNRNDSKFLSLKSCEFNKEKNKKSLGTIFDMLDSDTNDINIIKENEKEINLNKESNKSINDEIIENNKNEEINIIEEKKEKENNDQKNNYINIVNKEKEEEIKIKNNEIKEGKEENEIKEVSKKNEEKEEKKEKEKKLEEKEEIEEIEKKVEEEGNNYENLKINDEKKENIMIEIEENKKENNNIQIKNDKEKNENEDDKNKINIKESIKENNKINIIIENSENKKINNIEENIKNKDPKIELTGTKIDLVEKTENLIFSKKTKLLELEKYLNNNQYYLKKSSKKVINLKNEKILYEITQSFPKNKLLTEFFLQKITSLYLDNEEFLYCGEEKGNLLIYSIKDEKLVKQLENPFSFESKNNKQYPCINSINADDQYIIVGYQKGKFALFLKNEKKPIKTKIYDAFQEISQHNIIEIKIYSKKKNSILIYSCDDQENIFRTKIIKNKIFKNKVYTTRITGGLKKAKKKEPYYYLEINPFWYKCIGVVNNRGVNIYIIKKGKKDIIFTWNNLDEDNSFLSFFFSPKKEEKNKFFISNMNRINIYEINNDYNGVAQQNVILLEKNIIKIGYFINDLLYVFDQRNIIKLIDYNNPKNNDNNDYGFYDTITINNNNIEILKDKDMENYKFLINYNKFLCVKDGSIFLYNKNNILYLQPISLYDGVTNIYNSIFTTQNLEKWDILFRIGIDIYNKNHPLWKIDKMPKFQELFMNFSQSFLSLLIIQIGNNDENKNYDIDKNINKFNELISFLVKVKFYNFLTNEKNLYSIFLNSNIEDLYFYLLEPYIIEDNFMNQENIPISFISNLMDIYLNKKNKESKYIKVNKSWLSELLVHFDIKKYIEKKNNGLLENIRENYLINTIIYFILNYNSNEVMSNNLIDYTTPLNLLIRLLKLNIKKEQKLKNNNENDKKDDNKIDVDLKNEDLFVKENRYNDEIMFSTEYIRIKIIWYIYKILKNKILDVNEKGNEIKKSLFIKEILKIPLDEELFNNIVFDSFNNDENKKCCFLDREIVYILQIIFENEIISKNTDFSKEEIFQKLINLFKNRKESQISLNLLLVKSIINDKGIELSNEIKLNLVLFFMENNCSNSDIYPEIKEIQFQDNLIEILKLIDSYTFDDSEKLIKLVDICENNYSKLVSYIKTNFKN